MNSEETFVSLDLGTSNVKIVIGEMTGEALNVIGVGTEKSKGIKKGSIVDIDETVQSIQNAVAKAERMVDLSIKSVIVGVTGNHVELQSCHGIVAVSSEDREIGDEDITRVMDAAQVIPLAPEREIIDVIPRQFIVDGLDGISDPKGMVGVRLEMEGTIITGSKTILHNLLRCVEKSGLNIADICLSPLATGTMALSEDERQLGAALVNVGGGSTTISIYQDDVLQATSVLPIGGDHITKDISVGLKTSTDEADFIKRNHGHALVDMASEDEVFTVTKIGGASQEEFGQVDVAMIIEPRFDELLELIEKELSRSGYSHLPGGCVFTGGSVSMPGVLELAEDVFPYQSRIAVPDYIGVREPQYTTAVGLIQFTYRNAKIQGRDVARAVSEQQKTSGKAKLKTKAKQSQDTEKESIGQKIKNAFGLFFD